LPSKFDEVLTSFSWISDDKDLLAEDREGINILCRKFDGCKQKWSFRHRRSPELSSSVSSSAINESSCPSMKITQFFSF
jgi:hypothetical protein